VNISLQFHNYDYNIKVIITLYYSDKHANFDSKAWVEKIIVLGMKTKPSSCTLIITGKIQKYVFPQFLCTDYFNIDTVWCKILKKYMRLLNVAPTCHAGEFLVISLYL